MCARYSEQLQMDNGNVYGIINIKAVNALVIYAHNMSKVQPEKKIKRKDILLGIAQDLMTPFATQRYKLSTLPRSIKPAIVMCGFVSDCEQNPMQDPAECEAISRERGRCHVCSSSRDVETQSVCKGCGDSLSAKVVDIPSAQTISI
jgi:uncharacterized protein YbcC (UPF0753/DUF2309 family)